MTISRRGMLAAGGTAVLSLGAARALARTGYPFSLGVASGEPAADGVVLWTRLAPDPLAPHGAMPRSAVPVRWEVAEDPSFRRTRSGTAMARPEWGHSVHVEVAGLAPDRLYWYRFVAGGEASPVARTRTAPARGMRGDRLRICYGSCQNYEAGFWSAWRHAVADDPDLILFLGDYIYEGAPKSGGVRLHQGAEPFDLVGYRARYATYKLDPLLQAAHHIAPWISTWDDHEVANNYAGDYDEHFGDVAAFRRRRAAAYQAYWEHMPLRAAARPTGDRLTLYRTIQWGDLAGIEVIDDRQYRPAPPCQAHDAIARHRDAVALRPDCPERHDPHSMLGNRQEAWLLDRLATTRARWTILAQQTLMMSYRRTTSGTPGNGRDDLYNTDVWDGFPATRTRILRRMDAARTPNPLILSGDIHSFVAGDHAAPDDLRRLIASEFVGGSISSLNHAAYPDHATEANPGFRYAQMASRGYGRVDLTRDRCSVTFRGVTDARDPRSAARDLATFTVEAGRPGLQEGAA